MLLAVKTVKRDWCVSIRLLLVKCPLVYCQSNKSVCLLFVCLVIVVIVIIDSLRYLQYGLLSTNHSGKLVY